MYAKEIPMSLQHEISDSQGLRVLVPRYFCLSAVCRHCMTLLHKTAHESVETNHHFQASCSQLWEARPAKSS